MRLVITGAGGRIGRLLRLAWSQTAPQGLEPVFLDRAAWDILLGHAPSDLRPDVILDLAGRTRGDVAENPRIARTVAQWAESHSARLIYLSSAATYPGGGRPMRETDLPVPASAYGASKRDAEREVMAHATSSIILRLGNVAGADALLGGLKSGVPATLDPVADSDQGPVRSYIGPLTLARTLLALANRAALGHDLPDILNLAQPGPVSMRSLLEAKGHPWRFGPSRPGVLDCMHLATDRLSAILPIASATASGLVREWEAVAAEGWP